MRILRAALVLLFAVSASVRAQSEHRPWIQLDLGAIGIHERAGTQFHGTTSSSSTDIGLGIAAGIPITRWLVPLAGFHSSVGRDLPFHSISFGMAVRSTNRRRAYGHVAMSRMLASQGAPCTQNCTSTPNGNDRRWAFELRTGMNLIDPDQFTIGPTLWYQQSVSPTGPLLTTYKAFGLGIQIGFN